MARFFRLLSALLVVAAVLGCSESPDKWPSLKFEEKTWRAAPESERYKYVRDLTVSGVLIGKSESEALDLLGKPSSISETDSTFSYVVKVGGESFNKVFTLNVHFSGALGKVDRVSIRGD